MAPPPQNDDITRINTPLNFRHSNTLITTKVPQYPPKLTTGMSIIPGWNRPNANGQNANINDKDYNGPDFKARPLKHWRKQLRVNDYNGPANNSRAASIADLDRPGTTVYHFTPDCTCVADEGGNAYTISTNKFGYETKDDNYSKGVLDVKVQNNGYITVPYDATEEEVNDPANPAYKVLTGVYNTDCINCSPQGNLIKSGIALQSQAFYSSSNDKLESRCQTYEQNISTNKATGCNYFDAQGIPLWPNDTPNGPQVVAPVNYGSIIYKGNFFNLYEYGYNGIGVGAASEVNSAYFIPKIKCNPNYAVAGFYVNISPTTLLEATIYDSTNLVICKSTNTQYSYLNTNFPTPPSFSVAARIFYFPKNIFLEPSKSYYVNFKTINSVIFDWLVYNDSSGNTLSGVLVAEPIYCPSQTIYKPNNIAFGRQGAVSGSTRLKKLVSDTMTMNGSSFYSAKGAQEANLGKYQGTNLSSNYYLKTSPIIDSCRGTPPEPPILLFNNNDIDSITFSWKERGNNVCGIEYYTVTYYAVNIIERIRDVENLRNVGDIIDEEGMQDFFDVTSSNNSSNNINEINENILYNSQNMFTKNGIVNDDMIYTDNENNIRFNIISEIKTTNVESIPDPLTAENIAKISSLTPGTYYLMNMISANGNGTSIRSNTVLSNTLFDSEIEIDIKEVNYDYDDAKIKYNYNFTKPVILNVTLTSLHVSEPIILTVENAKTFENEPNENIAVIKKIVGMEENTYQVILENAGSFNLKATQEKGLSYKYGNSVATSPEVIIAKDIPVFSEPWDIFIKPPVIGKTYRINSPGFDNLSELPDGMSISYEVIIINDLGEESSDSDNIITITKSDDKTEITINTDGKFKIKAITNETQNYNSSFIISEKEYCIDYDTPEIEFTGEIVNTKFIYSEPKSFDIDVKFIHPEQQPQNMSIDYSIEYLVPAVTIINNSLLTLYDNNTRFKIDLGLDELGRVNWEKVIIGGVISAQSGTGALPSGPNIVTRKYTVNYRYVFFYYIEGTISGTGAASGTITNVTQAAYFAPGPTADPPNSTDIVSISGTTVKILGSGTFRIKATIPAVGIYKTNTFTSKTITIDKFTPIPDDNWDSIKEIRLIVGTKYNITPPTFKNLITIPAEILPITYKIIDASGNEDTSIAELVDNNTKILIKTKGAFKIQATTTGSSNYYQATVTSDNEYPTLENEIQIKFPENFVNKITYGYYYDFKNAYIINPLPIPNNINIVITYSIQDSEPAGVASITGTTVTINKPGKFKIQAETNEIAGQYLKAVPIRSMEVTVDKDRPTIEIGVDGDIFNFTPMVGETYDLNGAYISYPHPNPAEILPITYKIIDAFGNPNYSIANIEIVNNDLKIKIIDRGIFKIKAETKGSDNYYVADAISKTEYTTTEGQPIISFGDIELGPFTYGTKESFFIPDVIFIHPDPKPSSMQIEYISTNNNVAIVNGSHFTITGAGEFTIRATTIDSTENYKIATAEIYVTVKKADILFNEPWVVYDNVLTIGNIYNINPPKFLDRESLPNVIPDFIYESSNPLIADISGNVVIVKSSGEFKITATIPMDEMSNYNTLYIDSKPIHCTREGTSVIRFPDNFSDKITYGEPYHFEEAYFTYPLLDTQIGTATLLVSGSRTTLTVTQAQFNLFIIGATLEVDTNTVNNISLSVVDKTFTNNEYIISISIINTNNQILANGTSIKNIIQHAKSPAGFSINYESTNNDVATISKGTGTWVVTIKKPGSFSIKAKTETTGTVAYGESIPIEKSVTVLKADLNIIFKDDIFPNVNALLVGTTYDFIPAEIRFPSNVFNEVIPIYYKCVPQDIGKIDGTTLTVMMPSEKFQIKALTEETDYFKEQEAFSSSEKSTRHDVPIINFNNFKSNFIYDGFETEQKGLNTYILEDVVFSHPDQNKINISSLGLDDVTYEIFDTNDIGVAKLSKGEISIDGIKKTVNIITVSKAGTFTVIAKTQKTSIYDTVSIDSKVTISPATPTFYTWDLSEQVLFAGNNYFFNKPPFKTPLPPPIDIMNFTYQSSDNAIAIIADVNSEKRVIIKKSGEFTITATSQRTNKYNSATVSSTKRSTILQQPIIKFGNGFVEKITYGETYKFIQADFEYPTSSSNLSINYETSDENVATISNTTGSWVVTIKKVGSFTIIATTIENGTEFYETVVLPSNVINVMSAKPPITFGDLKNDIFPTEGALLVDNTYDFTRAIITLPSSVTPEDINITYESSNTFVATIPDAKIAQVTVINPGEFIITAKTTATNNFTTVSIESSTNFAYRSTEAVISFPTSSDYKRKVTYGDAYILPTAVFENPMPAYVPSTLTINYSIVPNSLNDAGVAYISGNNVILNKSGKFKIKAQAIDTTTTPKITNSDPIFTDIITVEKYQPVFKDVWDAISNVYEPLYIDKTIPLTQPVIIIPDNIPNILSEISPFTYTYDIDIYGDKININSSKVGNVEPPSITIKQVGTFRIKATIKDTDKYKPAEITSSKENSTYLSKPIIEFGASNFVKTIVLPRDKSYALSNKNQLATFTYPSDGYDILNEVNVLINYESTNSAVATISKTTGTWVVTVKKLGSFKIKATTTTTTLFTAIEVQESPDITVEESVSNITEPDILIDKQDEIPLLNSVVYGATLKVYDGIWDGTPAPTLTYQWYMNNNPITIPSSRIPPNTYTTTVSDIGMLIYCIVTGKNRHGEYPKKTTKTISICTFPINRTKPVISGTTMRSGDKLTVSNGTWDGTPVPAITDFKYQWKIVEGTTSTSIPGATANEYTPIDSYIGKNITCDVIADNKTGTFIAATSNIITVLKPLIFQDNDNQGTKTIITFNGPPSIATSPTLITANPRGTGLEWFAVVDDRSKDAIKNYTKGIISSSRNALNFNGVNDYVNLGIPDWTYSTQFRTTMTIECWFKTTDINSQKPSANFVTRWYSGNDRAQFMFGMNSSGNVYFYAEGFNGVQSTSAYKDAEWHHAAATFNSVNSELILYIDGSMVKATSSAGTSKLLTDERTLRLLIGSDERGTLDRQFRGSIADVRIWNVVRSDSDIKNNYLTQFNGNESGLVFYAKLNQGTANGNNSGVTTIQGNLVLPSGTTGTTPAVTGIATQYNSVGTGASSNGVYYASWCAQVSNSVCFAEYRVIFSNGVVSDMTIQSNSPSTLTNPSLLFAIKDVPIGGVKAILQGKNIASGSTDNKWYDVDVPVQQVNDNQSFILFTTTTGNFKTTTSIPVEGLVNFALSGTTSNWVSGPPLPVMPRDPSNNSIPIKNIVTTLMTDMSSMFSGATTFNQDISSWDTSKVKNMSSMFQGAAAFNQNIGKWNTPTVTNMSSMFQGAAVFNQNIGNWNTQNVINMSSMFSGATVFNQNIGNWKTQNVTNMSSMFQGAAAFNQNIGNWDTSLVTNMSSMFQGAATFNQIITWRTGNVTDMSSMFKNATAFNRDINYLPVDSGDVYSFWTTKNVTNMSSMFQGAAAFNGNISDWNTSKVTDMSSMFQGATAFNGNIGNWTTSLVTNMSSMFNGAAAFNQNINFWFTFKVTNMSSMFQGAATFNQNIGNWTTSLVTNMSSMFNGAVAFNQNIGNWNTEKVTDMSSMFINARSFNQPFVHTKLIIRTGGSDWYQRIINNDTSNENIQNWGYDQQWYDPHYAASNQIALQFRFYAAYVTKLYNISSGSATVFVYGGNMGTYSFTWNGSTGYTGSFNGVNKDWFYNLVTNVNPKRWNTSSVTNMSSMFNGAANFNQYIASWDTSSVTTMQSMFSNAYNFNQPLIQRHKKLIIRTGGSDWQQRIINNDTSDANIQGWNPDTQWIILTGSGSENQIAQQFRFYAAYVTKLYNISSGSATVVTSGEVRGGVNQGTNHGTYSFTWNGSTGYTGSFYGYFDTWTYTLPISISSGIIVPNTIDNWDTQKVTDMSYMFYNAFSFNNNISNWNTQNVTNMSYMFSEARIFNNNITNWDTSNVTTMRSMFSTAYDFNQPILSYWKTSKVTNMAGMFAYAVSFNNAGVTNAIAGSWDTGNVTDMSYMFESCGNFNIPIGGWNTSKVTNMYSMFSGAANFNQPIGGWDTSQVTDMTNMFRSSSKFNQRLNNWNTSKVTGMQAMFAYAGSFNNGGNLVTQHGGYYYTYLTGKKLQAEQILNWDVRQVRNMDIMFMNATSFFNVYIRDWNVRNDLSFQGFRSGCPITDEFTPFLIVSKGGGR